MPKPELNWTVASLAQLGNIFPEGVGRKWTVRFIEKHSEQLKVYNLHPLKTIRGHAVNPTTNKAWFDLLGKVLETGDDGEPIAPECLWAVDEVRFQPEIGPSTE